MISRTSSANSRKLTFTLNDPAMDHRTDAEKAAPLPQSSGSTEDFLEPGPTYIQPGAGFIFGEVGNKTSLMDFLPSKVAADALLEQYLKACHYINRVVHWPSFQVQYDNFWTNVLLGIEPAASVQALVFSIMFQAVASMTDLEIAAAFSRGKRAVLTNFQTGTEVALAKAHFLRSTKIEVIQSLVIYLIPMCRNEMSRAHAVLVGMAIRLGECMGLHRDPKDIFGASPVEAHVRRTVWYQLCFLDMRTNEAQGPKPAIRRDDYDTKFPYNINDADLLSADPRDSDTEWTDMTISRMRFECNEMHRVLFVDRQRLEKKQISLTHVLAKIESFRKAMEAKYHPIFDPSIPIQHYARLVMNILLLRMHIGVLHRYHNSTSTRIPDRLRQIILTSGTQLTEDAVKLDTDPEFKQWRWCNGNYQQYHAAFLLLVEVFAYPMRKEADRLWKCFDYIFETDRSLSRPQKARIIITELRDKTAVYRDIRKIRAPVSMMKRLYQKQRQDEIGESGLPTTEPRPAFAIDPASDLDKVAMSEASSPQMRDRIDSYNNQESPDRHSSISRSSVSSADPAFHTWTFDSPHTYYNANGLKKTKQGEFSGFHNPGQLNSLSPPNDAMNRRSPSASNTSDSWPPFITQNQNTWGDAVTPKMDQAQFAPSLRREITDPPSIRNPDNKVRHSGDPKSTCSSSTDLLMDIDWVGVSTSDASYC